MLVKCNRFIVCLRFVVTTLSVVTVTMKLMLYEYVLQCKHAVPRHEFLFV